MTGASDPMIKELLTPAIIRLDSSDFTLESTVPVTLYVKLISQKEASDTDTASFEVEVTFETVPCTPNLQLTETWPNYYEQRIGASTPLVITFSGAQNGDC